MTINSTIRKAGPFIGNGATTTFPFGFKVFAAGDVLAVKLTVSTNVQTTLVLNTDYTVTLNQDQDSNPGGSITLIAGALASGYTLTMTSDVENLQPTDLTNQGGFYPDVINDALDRATIQIQQIQTEVDSSLRLPLSSTASTELPNPDANQLIGWNSTGDGLTNIDPGTLASIVAYSTAYADTFTGNGSTVNWTLTRNPGTLYNLDISTNGVTQVPTADYTLSGTTLTTTSAAPLGSVILVKYKEGLPNTSGDSQDFRYLPAGTGAVATTVQAKLRESVSVLDFGAKGDGTTDDLAAFQAALAALPDTGGSLYIPATTSGIYRLSDTLNIIKPVRIYGQLATATASVFNAGTVLKFAANKAGIVFHAYNTYTTTVLGANYSIMENLAVVSAGGTGAYDGITIKGPGVRLNNVWSWFWPRHGITIDGSVGNADQWRLDNCYTNQNTRAGLYVTGSNGSAGVCTQLTTSNNGVYGVYDESFLGNTYIGPHAEGNSSFAYVTTGAVNSCVFIGAYTEPPQTSSFSPVTISIGGLGSSLSTLDGSNAGTVMTSGLVQGAPLRYINQKGSVKIGSAAGQDDTSMTAFSFGTYTESPTYDAWKLKFDNTNKCWTLQYANSTSVQPISYPNTSSAVYTNKGLTGPVFQNGYGVTVNGVGSTKVRLLGTAAPTTGTYEVGDIFYNSAPASGGYIGWVCTTAGTPGTWKTFGLIS